MATDNSHQLTIPQALKLASAHQVNGKLQEAEILLNKVLQVKPNNVFALHSLGCLAHQVNRLSLAIELLARAVNLAPDNPLFHRNIAEMYRQSGDTERAIAHGKQSILLEPNNAIALSNLGIAHFDIGNYQEAITYQQQALAIDPTVITALNNLGSVYKVLKDNDQAIHFYQKALAINPNYAESLNNLGAVFTEQSDPEQGLPYLKKAIQRNPNYAEAFRNIGTCYLLLEKNDEASKAFQSALKLRGNFSEALLGLAAIEQEANRFQQAEHYVNQAIALGNCSADGHAQLANLLNTMGLSDRAEKSIESALKIDPQNIPAHIGKGTLLTEQGKLDEANQCLQQALNIDPLSIAAHISLTQLEKVTHQNRSFIFLKKQEQSIDKLSKTKAYSIHFALGKCNDDIGQYHKGFDHYLKACKIKREKISYSQRDNTTLTLKIIATFTKDLITQLRGYGDQSAAPIFIVGMPRSGTTLTEQIIASHPECYGAGELPDLSVAVANNVDASEYPTTIKDITTQQLRKTGTEYIKSLTARQPSSRFITDKMPSNYFYVGLIHLILPNAKIIHVKRNPIDTCISNFSKLFKYGQHFSYNLKELGYYYRDYHNLMNHWRSVLPENAFYEINYEKLVENTEVESRALLRYCGMEWSDRCLEFNKNTRTIRTASVTQVRQPIYQSSVQRWRRYENQIEPLLQALGDLAFHDN